MARYWPDNGQITRDNEIIQFGGPDNPNNSETELSGLSGAPDNSETELSGLSGF